MRIVPLKAMEGIRKILARSARHNRPEIRDGIENSLISRSFAERFKYFKELDYACAMEMGIESKKAVSFQFAQIVALIQGTNVQFPV